MTKKLIVLISTALILLMAAPASASYIYSFSTGQGTTQISPLSDIWTAREYYNYTHPSAAPRHGYAADDSAYFWLYQEAGTDDLSLGVVFGKKGKTPYDDGGSIDFTLGGLPDSWYWDLQDDGGDIGGKKDTTPTWTWKRRYTDGGVISGLGGSEWDITWTLTDIAKHSHWYFLTTENGSISPVAFDLDKDDTLTLSAAAANAVPEPTTFLLLGLGLLGVSRISRTKNS